MLRENFNGEQRHDEMLPKSPVAQTSTEPVRGGVSMKQFHTAIVEATNRPGANEHYGEDYPCTD